MLRVSGDEAAVIQVGGGVPRYQDCSSGAGVKLTGLDGLSREWEKLRMVSMFLA